MAHVITFSSANFDISRETPNPINPLAGESVLNWLRGKLSAPNCETTKPATEDWGWYIDVKAFGSSYLVGASADAHEPVVPDVEWTVQIHKHRSLMEKVRGKNKVADNDPLSALIEKLLREEPGIRDVRHTSPGSSESNVVLNWQRGVAAVHCAGRHCSGNVDN